MFIIQPAFSFMRMLRSSLASMLLCLTCSLYLILFWGLAIHKVCTKLPIPSTVMTDPIPISNPEIPLVCSSFRTNPPAYSMTRPAAASSTYTHLFAFMIRFLLINKNVLNAHVKKTGDFEGEEDRRIVSALLQ
ncbi:hypothetical protein D3C85_1424340 [compost metagenome]